jgi:hypothetical protein
MPKVSTAQKLGIVTRVAGRQIRKTRTFGAVVHAGRTATAHWMAALSVLWLEVTGFVFLALAGIGLLAFFRELTRFHAGNSSSSRVWLAAGFTFLFGWFGVTSFWRVKKRE